MALLNAGQSRSGGFIGVLSHFRALFMKILHISIRRKGQTIAEIISAYIFIGLFLGLRYILDRRHLVESYISSFCPQWSIVTNGTGINVTYYYPQNPCTAAIVRNALDGLANIDPTFPVTMVPAPDPNLSSLSESALESLLAYVHFTNMDSCTNKSSIPDQVQYTLRMQENGLNYYRTQCIKLTDTQIRAKRSPEDFCQDYSVLVDYVNYFLGFQYAIDISIINYATGVGHSIRTPSVLMNHLGCPALDTDQFHTIYNFFIIVFIAFSYLITFLITVGYIVEERQNKTKEFLRIYGLQTWLNNLVWFTRSMCIYFVLTGVMTGLTLTTLPSTNIQKNSISKSIFCNTHWTVIWTALFVYSIQTSAFGVFFSQFFSRPLVAKMVGFIIWFFTFMDFYADVPVGALYILSIFPNIGLMYCITVILQYERNGDGATFSRLYSNLFEYPLYIGISLLLMLIYSCIYMILAIYIERVNPGEFGISQPWNFLCKKRYWKSHPMSSNRRVSAKYISEMEISTVQNNHWIETNSINTAKRPVLSIHHMTKKFGKLKAVKNISLDFYNGEVCSLLGHNGAGKTTTTFILVGMLEPTEGSLTVEGLDGRMHIQEVRKIIGFCPQYDILYDQLTVFEHLELIANMRQIRQKEAKQSVENILKLIGLTENRCTRAKHLSGGMKRRLSIGISLVGDPKVLILDEPTSGIDPYNRRLIWGIIRKMKEAGKCIIMTTHFLEEADVLSDRIAVMTKGQLQASGTPEFLKRHTDFEYRIFIEKSDNCDIENVTRFFHEHTNTTSLERHSTSELVFGVKRGTSDRIGQIIKGLDEQGETLGIRGYSLSMTTVEEVFLKLIEEDEEEEEQQSNDKKQHKAKMGWNAMNTLFHRKYTPITGVRLSWLRLYTLMTKRWILSRRQTVAFVAFFLVPLLIEIIAISALPSPKSIQASLLQNERVPNAQVTLIPSIYNPHTAVIYSNEADNKMADYLTNYLTSMGTNTENATANNITNYIQSRNRDSYDTYVNKYQMGFSIDKPSPAAPRVDIYYSTVNYHTMATGLSVATTSLFQYFANSSKKSIRTTNQPILTSSGSSTARAIYFDQIYCFDTVPLSLLNFINSIIAAIFISILALNVIRERITRSKDLQLLTNTSKKLYWLSNFVYDIILCVILSTLLTIIVKIGGTVHPNPDVEVNIYKGSTQAGYFFLFYLMYSLASLPLIYSYSFILQSELIGFIMFMIVNAMACFLDMIFKFIAVFLQASPTSFPTEMGSTTKAMLILSKILASFFPTVNFKQALFNIRLRSDSKCVTAINTILVTNYDADEPWESINEPGTGSQLVIFVGQMVFWWIVLTLMENHVKLGQFFCCLRNRTGRKIMTRTKTSENSQESDSVVEWDDSKLDQDVREERRTIHTNTDLSISAVLVVRDLVKQFRKRKGKSIFSPVFTAVDHLNFYVPKQTCFGLLGANGAGKTTTFRMLINDIQPTAGEIIIDRKNVNRTHNIDMGFCPQFDWLIEDLNVIETLSIFAKLKGIPTNEIPHTCNEMIEVFGLETYRTRVVQNLSGGNKRKLSAAVAFMANPLIVFLDEPTTGLDAGAKRKLWNVITAARDAGLTIIMTSHSMEECEALCTKIGIMKSGQFVCLGDLKHIKKRFGKGYAVQIKVVHGKMNEFQQQIKIILPGIEIEDEQNNVLFCNVPHSSSPSNSSGFVSFSSNLSLVFDVLNQKKEERIVESYSVSQTSLDQIFVRLAGHDKNDDDSTIENISIESQTNSSSGISNQISVVDYVAPLSILTHGNVSNYSISSENLAVRL